MTPERADVLVVGGGPAGSSCARALVEGGLDVIVIDRARFPRDKTCAGWITPDVVDLLDLDATEYGQSRVCQPISGFQTGLVGGRMRETRFGGAISYGICRIEFDDYLLKQSGASVRDGTAVTDVARAGGNWVVNGAFVAPVLVGAGGHQCPVARFLGATPAAESAVTAQEIEFVLSPDQQGLCRISGDTPRLSLCRDLRGYGWCFRKGDRLNVGFGRLDPHGLPAETRAFIEGLIAGGIVPADMPKRLKGHAYLLRDLSPRAAVGAGVVLVGDAAGLAASISGEGIRQAIESGQAAARVILEAGGEYGVERLAAYQSWLDTRYPRHHAQAFDRLPRPMLAAVVGGLLGTAWFTRRVLLERWFLQAA